MNRLIHFTLAVALACPTALGTTIVAVRTRDEIVIGADSKVTDTLGAAFTRQECKILQAGDLFFAYAGFARNRKTGFDVPLIARSALQLKRDATAAERVSILTGFLTSRLFNELAYLKQNEPEAYGRKFAGRVFLSLLIAGFEKGKPLLFVRRFRAIPLSSRTDGVSVLPDDCLEDCQETTVTRFLGETEAIDGLPEETPDFWDAGLTEGVRKLIELEIMAREEYVGPPVDILRIRGSAASWVQRKTGCAEVKSYRNTPAKRLNSVSRSSKK